MNLNDLAQPHQQIPNRQKTIHVQITYKRDYRKPFIGGFKDLYSNKAFYHAFSQTDQPKTLHVVRFERETQTVDVSTKTTNAKREFGTQTKRQDLYIDDRNVEVTIIFIFKIRLIIGFKYR